MFKHNSEKSFTLIETLVVIAIMGIMTSIVSLAVRYAVNRSHYVRMREEIRIIGTALEMYLLDNDYKYPCDVNRGLPNGIDKYLGGGTWAKPSWPNSEYDWDYWHPDPPSTGPHTNPPPTYCAGTLTTDGNPEHDKPVYQLSIRFCTPSCECSIPQESWAQDFDCNSSVYYCIMGPCRAHGSQPYDHAGCCIGGVCPADQDKCEWKI